MKFKKICYSTQLQDLYGDHYVNHLEVGREYWIYDEELLKRTDTIWNKIKITYKRSGVCFYDLCDFPDDFPEQFFPENCFLARTLEFAELNPEIDLDWGHPPKQKAFLEKRYCFDDTRTKVINWDNSKYSELEESEMDIYDKLLIKK